MAIIADIRVLNPRQWQPGTYEFPAQSIPPGAVRIEGRVNRSDANDPTLDGLLLARYEVDISRDNGNFWELLSLIQLVGGENWNNRENPPVLREWDYHRITHRRLLSEENPSDANTMVRGRLIVFRRISSETWVTLFDA